MLAAFVPLAQAQEDALRVEKTGKIIFDPASLPDTIAE